MPQVMIVMAREREQRVSFGNVTTSQIYIIQLKKTKKKVESL